MSSFCLHTYGKMRTPVTTAERHAVSKGYFIKMTSL